jgi:His-Xaa-Ser system protein HxsD
MNKTNLPWVKNADLSWSRSGETFALSIDTTVYSLDAVLKTCYLFLDECYLFVEPNMEDSSQITVYFSPSNQINKLEEVIGEFSNRLLWQEVRQKVAAETQVIREVIVAQALAEGNILDQTITEADYNADPLRIAE